MIDNASMCRRYHECLSIEHLQRFERLLFERFGVTPLSAIPANEAILIYREIFEMGATK